MDTIGKAELWSFKDQGDKPESIKSITEIRRARGHLVSSYLELARKISELQYRNPSYVLLYRGQTNDYKNIKNNTTLKPSLFRALRETGKNPNSTTLVRRFSDLIESEQRLLAEGRHESLLGSQSRIERQRILRWALLQHYEVCLTLLLDVTHSLRIACSFASGSTTEEAYIFVLGVPNLSGAITASAESGLQILRLSSVCLPSAVRPHIQEGYLLGEYPDLADIEQKQAYRP